MNHLLHWLALSRMYSLGPISARAGLNYFKTIEALLAASSKELQQAGFNKIQTAALRAPDWQQAEKDALWMEKNQAKLITFLDADYPPLLAQIYDAPLMLYVQGEERLLAQPQLAIVGSRHATITGREIAKQFANDLATAGWVITSGLALGIDAASHQGALKAGGNTLAILGTGLQHIYPRAHQKLAEEIVQKGALISEFPLNSAPKAAHFPRRNRVISGLSAGVLVVEAALRSGSLITARTALEQNREVFAIPGSIHNPLARGCHQLIQQGATLVETIDDILQQLPFFTAKKPLSFPASALASLDDLHQQVLAQIGYEVTALDVIIMRARLTPAQVSSMLLGLELEGHVQQVPGGYVRVIPAKS